MGDHTRKDAADERRSDPRGSAAEGLHPDRTFVVQLRCSPGARGAELVGRVEHVVSGEVLRFRSTAELIAFLAQPARSSDTRSPAAPAPRPR